MCSASQVKLTSCFVLTARRTSRVSRGPAWLSYPFGFWTLSTFPRSTFSLDALIRVTHSMTFVSASKPQTRSSPTARGGKNTARHWSLEMRGLRHRVGPDCLTPDASLVIFLHLCFLVRIRTNCPFGRKSKLNTFKEIQLNYS